LLQVSPEVGPVVEDAAANFVEDWAYAQPTHIFQRVLFQWDFLCRLGGCEKLFPSLGHLPVSAKPDRNKMPSTERGCSARNSPSPAVKFLLSLFADVLSAAQLAMRCFRIGFQSILAARGHVSRLGEASTASKSTIDAGSKKRSRPSGSHRIEKRHLVNCDAVSSDVPVWFVLAITLAMDNGLSRTAQSASCHGHTSCAIAQIFWARFAAYFHVGLGDADHALRL
jgi:hypothetical protein